MKNYLLLLASAIMMLAGSANANATKVVLYSDWSWNTPYFYCWDSDGNYLTAWPGDAMTRIASDMWLADVPDGYTNLIFNSGDDSGQTGNLTVPTDDKIVYYQSSSSWGNGCWQTFDADGNEITDGSTYEYGLSYYISGGNASVYNLWYNETQTDPVQLVIPETISQGTFTVTCIDYYAFDESTSSDDYTNYHTHNCTLGGVTLPSTLVKMCDHAFYNCASLMEVVLPEGFTTLGHHAFKGCSSLNKVTFPSTLSTFEMEESDGTPTWGYTFEGTALEEVDFSACRDLSDLGTGTFYGVSTLTNAYLPNTLDKIEANSVGGSVFPDGTNLFIRHTTSKAVSSFTSCIEGETLDFSGSIEGLTAYSAQSETDDGTAVNMAKVATADVPQGEGLVLYTSTPGTFDIPLASGDGTAVSGNLLVGQTSSDALTDYSNVYYVKDAAFHPASDGTLAKGKAYLDGTKLSASGAKTINFGTTTGIETVCGSQSNGMIYNVMGQKVATPKHGLYIQDGRKIMVK